MRTATNFHQNNLRKRRKTLSRKMKKKKPISRFRSSKGKTATNLLMKGQIQAKDWMVTSAVGCDF